MIAGQAVRRRGLTLALVVLGAVLSATVIPAVYTIDENNYLSTVVGARHGGFVLPGTEGLPPSFELYWFDPFPRSRGEPHTPVMTSAPPLYALIALPFSLLGWRGLVALNTLAFLAAIGLVFHLADRPGAKPSTPWLAAGVFALAGYNIEYAQGMWPHMLSVALCLASFVLATRARLGEAPRLAVAAGLAIGLACGVRYQNVVLAGWIAAGLLAWSSKRWVTCGCFVAGMVPPLSLSALINGLRSGYWHPVSKGAGYASPPSGWSEPAAIATPRVPEPARVLWAKVFDFGTHPPIAGQALGPVPEGQSARWGWEPDELGAFLWHGGLKKAWVQSSPWVVLALVAMALAWRKGGDDKKEVRAISLVVGGMLALFAVAGFGRHDGLAFNQRYFLELVPLAAVALAWSLDGLTLPRRALLGGAAVGASLTLPALIADPGSFVRTTLLLKVPLLLSAALVLGWLGHRRKLFGAWAPAGLLGACCAWALFVHLGDDVAASRRLRAYSLEQTTLLAQTLPERSALLTFGTAKDAAGPLLLERDLVILDALPDGGADSPVLIEALLARGRRVFVDLARFPPALFDQVRKGLEARVVVPGPEPIVELTRSPIGS